MKKWKNAFVLVLSALAVSACAQSSSGGGDTSSSSSETISASEVDSSTSSSASSSASSSSSEDLTSPWSEEQKALMKEYCGSVLPHPGSKMSGEINFDVIEDSGDSYLVISSEASSFTLENYYEELTGYGWNVIEDFNGKKVQTDSQGLSFVELTSVASDKSAGYDLVYYYSPSYTDDAGNEVLGKNIIQCYNDLSATSNPSSAWSTTEAATIKEVTTTTLPFVALGEFNGVVAYSDSVLRMADLYAVDLTSTYAEALEKDGFALDLFTSMSEGSYVLNKVLPDKSTVQAILYYMNGNRFIFSYTPHWNTYSAWPSDLADEIKQKTGFELPTVDADEGGHFYAYKKNDTYVIQVETTDVDAYSYEYDLESAGLSENNDFAYANWGETIAINVDDVMDDDYNYVGIQLTVNVTEPTSIFSSAWPSQIISSTLKDAFGIEGVELPVLSDLSTYSDEQIKYVAKGKDYVDALYEYYLEDIAAYPDDYADLPIEYTEDDIKSLAKQLAEDEGGVTIQIKDNEFETSANAYSDLLNQACWHKEGAYDGYTYEDPEGKVSITVQARRQGDDAGVTTITFKKGSGEAHSPVFEFASSSYQIGIGKSQKLQLNVDMLPYEVTYTSSDPDKFSVNQKGFVSVSSSASDGDSATITATLTTSSGEVKTATCTVSAKEILDYDADSAIDAVIKLLGKAGYSSVEKQTDDNDNPYVQLTFDTSTDTSVSANSLMELAEGSLIPQGFEISYGMDVDTGDEITWTNRWITEPEAGTGKSMDCYFTFEDDENEKAELTYWVYTLDENPSTLILKITGVNCDIIW